MEDMKDKHLNKVYDVFATIVFFLMIGYVYKSLSFELAMLYSVTTIIYTLYRIISKIEEK